MEGLGRRRYRGYMNADTAVVLVVASLPAVAVLLTVGELFMFRRVMPASEENGQIENDQGRWTPGQVAAFAGLIMLSLMSFWVAHYSLWLSFFVPPWQVLWPTAGALSVTGLAGLVTAGVLLFKRAKWPILILLAGLIDIAVAMYAWSFLLSFPRVTR